MEIANRHVLVTGASRGIGRAFAKMCAEDKANLYLVLRKNDEEIVKELQQAGAKSVKVFEADLRQREAVAALIEELKDIPVDILFNNAGILTGGLIEEQNIEHIYQMMQVNVNSLIQLTHGVLPGMIARKRGKIINNSSVSAYMHFPCASTYAASKAAVAAFTDCIRLELKETGVTTLLLITPGIRTRMFDEVETVFSKNFQIPEDTMSPHKYAQMIREAILHDLPELEPSGLTGVGLKVAKFVKPLFEIEVSRRFKRN
ncbi:SDR family NAD(P)-dependent oxidoreductase [Bdellovibrio bacteriovorus]